jgi:hypothetical protein
VVLGRVLCPRVVRLRYGCSAAPCLCETVTPRARQLQRYVRLWESGYIPALARSFEFRTVPDESIDTTPLPPQTWPLRTAEQPADHVGPAGGGCHGAADEAAAGSGGPPRLVSALSGISFGRTHLTPNDTYLFAILTARTLHSELQPTRALHPTQLQLSILVCTTDRFFFVSSSSRLPVHAMN